MRGRITLAAIDHSRVRWEARDLEARLRSLWAMRGRALVLPLTVRNLRMIAVMRQRLDREGWTVRCQSQLKSETIAVFIHMKRYGARPARGSWHRRAS